LGSLLKLARDAGRVLVLASDHGHVWHRPDAQLQDGETGTRWRPDSNDLRAGEISVRGSRVRGDNDQNAIVVPWTEAIYYGRQQNGYHGGGTPQEMACPLVILTDKSSAYSGLYPCEYPKPDWWSPRPTTSGIADEPPVPVVLPVRSGPPTLFDNLPEDEPLAKPEQRPEMPAKQAAPAVWIDRLFLSQVYKAQKEFIRRHAPEDDLVRRCLVALDLQGGIMTPVAFSKATDVPAARLDGLIARIQRLLNVDGYEILTLSRAENRIELNVVKLQRQFDLD
jgi:hypothetical protein